MALTPGDIKQLHLTILDGQTISLAFLTNDKKFHRETVKPIELPGRLAALNAKIQESCRRI